MLRVCEFDVLHFGCFPPRISRLRTIPLGFCLGFCTALEKHIFYLFDVFLSKVEIGDGAYAAFFHFELIPLFLLLQSTLQL